MITLIDDEDRKLKRQESIPVGCVSSALHPDRDPPGQRPPGQKPPLDRHPPEQRPPRRNVGPALRPPRENGARQLDRK